MSTPADTDKPTSPNGPESPTTARPFEMDDDDVQESGILGGEESTKNNPPTAEPAKADPTTQATTEEEAPPSKPPRPQTEAQKNAAILKEAFPSIDENVIKAILSASGGRIDPAFNALLDMTDPDATKNEPQDEAPPQQPPRPARGEMSQMEADEIYARQLAERWDNVGAYEARTSNRAPGGSRSRQQPTGLKPNELHDKEHSFFDDDLPVIQERLKQGFNETQGKVNSWIQTMKKRFDEEFTGEEDDNNSENRQRPAQGQEQFPGPRPGRATRKSGDYERYDADPQVLSDDFAGMKFNSDGTPVRTSGTDSLRPGATKSSDGRKVSFRDGAEEIDVYGATPNEEAKPKSSKWQPLSSIDPNPINENDPFSLGDSEDEREAKERSGSRGEIKMDDNDRLKQAAAEAMADELAPSNKPQESGVAAVETKKE